MRMQRSAPRRRRRRRSATRRCRPTRQGTRCSSRRARRRRAARCGSSEASRWRAVLVRECGPDRRRGSPSGRASCRHRSTPPRPSGSEPMRPTSSRRACSCTGPPARRIAPSTPPPPSSPLFAAFTTASTRCSTMSPPTTVISIGNSLPDPMGSITTRSYPGGDEQVTTGDLDEVSDLLAAGDGEVVWIDLDDPSKDDLVRVAERARAAPPRRRGRPRPAPARQVRPLRAPRVPRRPRRDARRRRRRAARRSSSTCSSASAGW